MKHREIKANRLTARTRTHLQWHAIRASCSCGHECAGPGTESAYIFASADVAGKYAYERPEGWPMTYILITLRLVLVRNRHMGPIWGTACTGYRYWVSRCVSQRKKAITPNPKILRSVNEYGYGSLFKAVGYRMYRFRCQLLWLQYIPQS